MKRGFTKAWRKELESEIWDKNPIYHRVFFYLRQKATWESNEFPTDKIFKINLAPGQLITSLDIIAEGVSWFENKRRVMPARKTILKILSWLEINGMIIRHSNNEGTFISICNWSTYQVIDNQHGNRLGNTVETGTETGAAPLLKKIKELEEEIEKNKIPLSDSEKPNPTEPVKKSKSVTEARFIELCQEAFQELGQGRMFDPLKNSLTDFFQMRKQKKVPIKTEMSVGKVIKQLAEMSNLDLRVAQAILDNSIANEYQGLFMPRYFGSNGKHETFQERRERETKEQIERLFKEEKK